MKNNDGSIGGKSFYQSEPLIARLRGIIRDYPEGVGIIKELIQNADDAKATRVEITLDWRYHQGGMLPDERMTQIMGPAILVYNNQVFTDKDFDSIRSLGQSEKAQDLHKTGRFGVGFNAIYHVTDYPSFVSRDRIIFFDPHGAAIPGTSKQEPGREWNLVTGKWYEKYPDFMKVYESGGLLFGDTNFQGTLFRLPLRTPIHAQKSEIRQQPFTESNIRELLAELIQSGEEMLLFLKSVQEIYVYEIPATEHKRQEILKIVTKNHQEVAEARQKVLNAIPDNPETLVKLCRNNPDALASVSYRHEIETISQERRIKSTWRVVGIIRIDEGDELAKVIEAMHQSREKVLPWAGAAARISISSTEENCQPVAGKVYCFLPLPIEIGLPIHINGFFNLNSSRDNLSSDSGQTGKDRHRAIWNQLLVRHVLSHAYVNLIVDLVQDIGQFQPEDFYNFWPLSQITVSKALEELHRFVIELLYNKKVVRSAVENPVIDPQFSNTVILSTRWITPQEIKILPSKKWWEELVEPLSADNIDISDPHLPESIQSAFKDANCQIETFTPHKLRQHLSENKALGISLNNAPKASLRNRQSIVNMLRYCISDKHNDLRGLPLAILANNTLQVFGYNPIGTIYIADDKQRQIFASYLEWFLHPDLFNQVPEIASKIGVLQMNATEVAKKLVNIISVLEPVGYTWQPEAVTPPNAEWLTLIYNYFRNIYRKYFYQEIIDELKKVPLVPGDDGKLYKGGFLSTPLLVGDKIDEETIAALKYFKVTFVKAPAKLEEAIANFANYHGLLIYFITGSDVLDTIYWRFPQDLPPYNQAHYNSLLNFFAHPDQRNYTENQHDKLRKLRIYPTTSNEIVSLDDENVYIPGDGYQPPEIAGTLRLLQIGITKEWLPLFHLLKVPVLNRARLIRDCLLADYPAFAPEEQLIALAWIRDNLEKASQEIKESGEDTNALKQEIKKARLVRCNDRRLRAADLTYSPESEVVRSILGNLAAIPDMQFYSEESELWLKFFAELGMKKTPSPDDLLACIENLIQTANVSGVDAVSGSCIAIFNYIVDHWVLLEYHRLSNNQTLAEALKDKPWLPVEYNLEILSQYPAAIIPESRLYRAKDVCFKKDAYLVASQKPIFDFRGKSIKVEIQRILGFQPVETNMILDHFDTLITTWENDD
ncbi:hypothetical protein [Kamptonema sp. UHCC 0994]|uniref:sacsin N-terminal ATP-binding-like domain-containing protein n=1 Tax=Kamptonema sp. UHCC 0994 TaxID=3031329 RepID=UPI0023B8A434|nr:hypothetical protein [Kamptonema sp. UHCC 0994]MDF0553699.1 hypothetical protein [Kamptonema sp. UHCC 0994]